MNREMQHPSHKSLKLLSRLVLPFPQESGASSSCTDLGRELVRLSRAEFDDLIALANSNHVVVRGLERFLSLLSEKDSIQGEWAESALKTERARIEIAIQFLREICGAFERRSYTVVVIKTLDHWPDLGSDLDLFTQAQASDVIALMTTVFGARIASRSWGDRLARKWNFMVPGLPEAVEIHVGRLGQTGEQVAIAAWLLNRSQSTSVEGSTFRTVSASDRVMLSTLQRMYRHFYFRLCDIVDTVALADRGAIDYDELRASAKVAGIWEGAATYLAIVSDYARSYRGVGLDLPGFVLDAARFGGDPIYYEKSFLRVPIMPESAALYRSQLAGVVARGELHNGVRLSLLPWLATAAVVGQRLTGSDKGIW